MKSRIDAILRRPQAEYLDSLVPARDALLERMEKYAAESRQPIADPEVAQVMRILVRLAKPKRILEVGTNIGYSVVVLGRECGTETTIESIEIDPKLIATANEFITEAELLPEVLIHEGAALDVLPTLAGPFDFVFIDCVKTEYGDYLDLIKPRLSPGALVVCDNLLWKGQVAEEPRSEDQVDSTESVRTFNRRITEDEDFLTSIMAVGDGLGVSLFR